jgi:hypothetical protein
LFVTECKAEFSGHQVAARNSWGPTFSFKGLSGENRLYIDGKVADTNSETLAVSDSPIMRGQIVEGDKVHVVEVYARSGLFRVKLRIHIDGKKVAGEDF